MLLRKCREGKREPAGGDTSQGGDCQAVREPLVTGKGESLCFLRTCGIGSELRVCVCLSYVCVCVSVCKGGPRQPLQSRFTKRLWDRGSVSRGLRLPDGVWHWQGGERPGTSPQVHDLLLYLPQVPRSPQGTGQSREEEENNRWNHVFRGHAWTLPGAHVRHCRKLLETLGETLQSRREPECDSQGSHYDELVHDSSKTMRPLKAEPYHINFSSHHLDFGVFKSAQYTTFFAD